jgi:PAS domain S-box-containing protein
MNGRAGDAFIEQDARGILTGWSAEAEQLFGWSSAEAIGMRAHRLVPERNRARADEVVARFLASADRRAQRVEVTALHRDGHEFHVEFTSTIVQRESGPCITTTVRAITADERAERAFRQTERYRAILNQLEDGCAVIDLRGNYLFVNDAFCRLFGFTKEHILGRNFKDTQNPARHARTFEVFNNVYRTGEPVTAYEYQVAPSNLFVEQSITLERDADGRAIGFLSVYRDCTARKLAEADLAHARDAAEAANRAKSEFLANMSHEIRTPMNGIIGMTTLAMDSELTPQQADCLATIRSQADLLLAIVNDILDFSKIESRHIDLESLTFALDQAVKDVVKPLAVKAAQKGLTLSSGIATDAPAHLVGDPVRFKQILTNLIANAVKFTERGSVGVEVTIDERQADRATLHVRVADTGIGIPADKLATIFEPFRQVDGSMSRRFGGTGLGLAIASTLAGLMGGRIWVESAHGAGTTFHFVAPFPVGRAGAGFDAGEAAPRARAPHVSRVLVAEDNVVNQRVAAGLLTRRGHEVTVVSNGREALDALQHATFDLVLMDVQMPDMDGFEATAAIRAWERESGRHVRIVAMTAHALAEDRDRCLAAGMDGYLSKPISHLALFDIVEQ